MSKLSYLTHPQVEIDPATPVPDWGLSDLGRGRIVALAESGAMRGFGRIVSSAERKAMQVAGVLGDVLGVEAEIAAESGENDRSATGYLPGAQFEAAADAFFAKPDCSYQGWETARDAQRRIVSVYSGLVSKPGDLLMVGHGAVGTLLLCHLAGWPIDRKYDQPAGGGHIFTYDLAAEKLLHGWKSIEDIVAGC